MLLGEGAIYFVPDARDRRRGITQLPVVHQGLFLEPDVCGFVEASFGSSMKPF